MKQLITILMIWLPIIAKGQTNLSYIEKSNLTKEITYKGDFLNCTKWADSLGLNYLVFSQSEIIKPPTATEVDFRNKEIYAYHYLQTSDSTYVLWKLLDYERECPFDLTLDFLTEKPIITDLDNNGICETWIVYWLGCRSDVSALNMKLIMHEGKNKYAIRGTRKVKYGAEPDQVDGGKMTKDKSFDELPKIITDYAIDLWTKYNSED